MTDIQYQEWKELFELGREIKGIRKLTKEEIEAREAKEKLERQMAIDEFISVIDKAKNALEEADNLLENPLLREYLIEEGYDMEHYVPFDYLTDVIVGC